MFIILNAIEFVLTCCLVSVVFFSAAQLKKSFNVTLRESTLLVEDRISCRSPRENKYESQINLDSKND